MREDQSCGLLAMRTRPGSTTAKPSCSRTPTFATASTTAAGLARRARLWNFTKMTPADRRPRAYTNSPKFPVLRNEHTALAQRALHHLFVGCTFSDRGHREHVVA